MTFLFYWCAPASIFLTLHLASARLSKRLVPFYLTCVNVHSCAVNSVLKSFMEEKPL